MHTLRLPSSGTTRLALGLAALPLLAGCGGGGSGGLRNGGSLARSVSATTPQGLTATLTEDPGTTLTGGIIIYTLTLTNATRKAITFETRTGCGVDGQRVGGAVKVLDPTEAIVYPDPNAGTCTEIGISPTATLAPGQSVSDTFEAPAVFNSGGTYNATAVFSVQAPDASGFTGTQVGPLPLAVSTVVN